MKSIYWFILSLLIFIYIIVVRKKLINLQENLNNFKSRMLVAKNKYYEVLEHVLNTNKDINESVDKEDGRKVLFQSFQSTGLVITSDLVKTLANNYEEAQNSFNERVNEYNKYVRRIHVIPVAFLLRFKKNKYVE